MDSTHTIRALIVDDDPASIGSLQNFLSQHCPGVEIVAVANDVGSGLNAVKAHAFDVLLLDIEMPDGTGFDLLDQLDKVDFDLVFITAYNQYALKAFRYAAIDYLMKPVDPEELVQAIERINPNERNDVDKRVSLLLENHHAEKPFEKIAISTTEGVYYLTVDKIRRCEAHGSYTKFFFRRTQSDYCLQRHQGIRQSITRKFLFPDA